MEQIKIGEYIRTNYGIIDKIINKDDENHFLDGEKGTIIDLDDRIGTPISDVIKHSNHLKDLVEVKDIVNGYLIDEITPWGVLIHKARGINSSGFSIPVAQYDEDIKTILTHEQYENNCYERSFNK